MGLRWHVGGTANGGRVTTKESGMHLEKQAEAVHGLLAVMRKLDLILSLMGVLRGIGEQQQHSDLWVLISLVVGWAIDYCGVSKSGCRAERIVIWANVRDSEKWADLRRILKVIPTRLAVTLHVAMTLIEESSMVPRFWLSNSVSRASQVDRGKDSTCQCRRHKRWKFDPWVGKIPWSRKW